MYGASLDLLVVGSRVWPDRRLTYGSTSRELVRMARCPLLVLARVAAATETPEVVSPGREAAAARPG